MEHYREFIGSAQDCQNNDRPNVGCGEIGRNPNILPVSLSVRGRQAATSKCGGEITAEIVLKTGSELVLLCEHPASVTDQSNDVAKPRRNQVYFPAGNPQKYGTGALVS
ncbi:MAG: hypothetical protein WB608_21505 [Terracidiphilus sp.]